MNDAIKNQDAFGRIKAEIIDHMPHLKDDLNILIRERANEAFRLEELEEFYRQERNTQQKAAELRNILKTVYDYLKKNNKDSIDEKIFIEIEKGMKRP